ncbi:MAG: SagB/ThcOx family dehydrogenase [Candidatus Magnetominusculus sp. LBB02]|nr:SagB/ThcOx family dehydrogenase [Candidatus Magnetominusculus sp. LBB02]
MLDVFHYHEATKHRVGRYAKSAGHMDWENEPAPLRIFDGAETVKLPFLEKDPDASYDEIFQRRLPSKGITLCTAANFLELSLALAAWKSYGGSAWALRINPSSGNLHAEETYVLMPEAENSAALYHYNPYFHVFEKRAAVDAATWKMAEDYFGVRGFFIVMSSIHWREAWKYGERAFRYACLDIGHAVAAMSVSASLFGLKATALCDMSCSDIAALLGTEKTQWIEYEEEVPETVLFIHEHTEAQIPRGMPCEIIECFKSQHFAGMPNRLSKTHVSWDIIKTISRATEKPKTEFLKGAHTVKRTEISATLKTASHVIRTRRSGQMYDSASDMPLNEFISILSRTLPGTLPFNADIYPTQGAVFVHLLVYVHRVAGLPQGIYMFVREDGEAAGMRGRMSPDFLWDDICKSGGVPLYLLRRGNFGNIAAMISCGQEIAGDGAFSISMISRFAVDGASYMYRRLFWEAGMIGQMLYLEAEARGFRGTGIGCFFDDEVHKLLGLQDNYYQCLYNFTIGNALEDKRLTTLAAYHHLSGSGRANALEK